MGLTHRKPYTYKKYAVPSSNALKAFFGGKRLSQISPFLIEKYKLNRKAAGKSEVTINRSLTFLRSLFNNAIEWSYSKSNPFRRIVNGKVHKVELYKETGRTRWRRPDGCWMRVTPISALLSWRLSTRGSESPNSRRLSGQMLISSTARSRSQGPKRRTAKPEPSP